jgi:uncharacterized membrane protein YfcA
MPHNVLLLSLVILLSSVLAGAVGSLLGLGGGVIMIPVMTLILHVPFPLAVGASIVSVIATSSGAAATYVRDRLTNLRVGMFLEIATTTGAITGAFVTTLLNASALSIIFGLVLLYSIYPLVARIFRDRAAQAKAQAGILAVAAAGAGTAQIAPQKLAETVVQNDRLAESLAMAGTYYDPALKQQVAYGVRRVPWGMGIMYGAGVVSGLLGIGGGVFKVLAMDSVMGMPIKASSATSNFMIGATAAASAGIYFLRGDINPVIAAPVALGVLAGSLVGTRLLARLAGNTVRLVFAIVMAFVALQMLLNGFGVQF